MSAKKREPKEKKGSTSRAKKVVTKAAPKKKSAPKKKKKIEEDLEIDEIDEIGEIDDVEISELDDEIDQLEKELMEESSNAMRERPTPVSGPRRVLVVEPDETRRKLMVAIVCELMPGSSVQEAEDEDEAEVALEEDEFEMAILDLQVPGFSSSEFVRTVNNNESTILVSLNLNNLEPGDEKNKSKIDPLRKLFE